MTTWHSALDYRIHPTQDWVTDGCERALQRSVSLDADFEVLGVMSPLAVIPGSERRWTNSPSLLLADSALAVSRKLGLFKGSLSTLIYPRHEMTSCALAANGANRVEIVLKQTSVGLEFSILDWWA